MRVAERVLVVYVIFYSGAVSVPVAHLVPGGTVPKTSSVSPLLPWIENGDPLSQSLSPCAGSMQSLGTYHATDSH